MTADPDGRRPEDNSSADQPSESADAAKPSRLRIWLFRIIAATVISVVLLGLVEVGLRVAGYGYDTSFFVERQGVYASNNDFGLRFFPAPTPARTTWPAHVEKVKALGTYRIFVMGGSAAQGVPDPAFGFGHILETMLAETYPNARFEVVVTAITAINSHVVLPIARDCAKHEPDLFIVYLGNNEVIGPFGPGTVFQGFSPNLTLIRTYLAVQKAKLGQLTVSLMGRLSRKKVPEHWGGMEMFLSNLVPADDERLETVYSHFGRNLYDICRAGRKAGADTILCTVGVNLRHCAPFASTHSPGLSDIDLAMWDRAFQAGVELDEAGDVADAISKYLAAEQIDGRYAELQFRLGRCYLAVGEPGLARYAFAFARDLDALRFRADSDINRVIREVAEGLQNDRVYLVDAERAVAKSDKSPDRLPGEELFYEHVHMTFDGNYEVARAVFEQVVAILPDAIRSANPSPVPPSRQHCAKLMGLTPWQHAQMFLYMLRLTEHPPFTGQFGYAERRAAMEETYRQLESQIDGASRRSVPQ